MKEVSKWEKINITVEITSQAFRIRFIQNNLMCGVEVRTKESKGCTVKVLCKAVCVTGFVHVRTVRSARELSVMASQYH